MHLDQLAELAGWSPCHFHRIFIGVVGETVADHVRRVRLERAALAMRAHGATVLRIALDAGYQDHSAFARAFRQRFGCTPSAWRRRPRPLPPPHDLLSQLAQGRSESTMDIQIRTLDPLRVAFVRHLGPYQDCGGAWQQLIGWAGKRGLLRQDAVFLGVGHDDPAVTEPARIRYDACIVVPDGTAVEGGIGWYNVTKAAVIHLTSQLAGELGPLVRVNALAPGLVKTEFARALWESGEEAIAARLPLRRLGEVDDIANAALFLCSDAASWITGHTLVIDGGALCMAGGGLS